MTDEHKTKPLKTFSFNRMEVAGSLGDLGTLLPLGMGLIVLNGLNATSILLAAGVFYIVAGTYFRIPVAVQPMKAIATYAIAVGLTPIQVSSAGLLMGLILLLLGLTGLIDWISKHVPKSVVRGIQFALGTVLITKGLKLMGEVDDFELIQALGPIPIGLVLGAAGIVIAFALISSKRFPAAIVLVLLGIILGLILGKPFEASEIKLGFHLPSPLPYGIPSVSTLLGILPLVVLPQIPMTIGNAVISNTNLAKEYFPEKSFRMTDRASTISQGIANLFSFAIGGMPMCHGAGGLAAHYRFGARTAGSNLIIGGIFVFLALILGESLVGVLNLVPLAILGVLLAFAGLQLALMVQDINDRKDLLVVVSILGITLTFNLAVAFVVGIAIAYIAKSKRFQI